MAPPKSRLEIASLARSHSETIINVFMGIVTHEKSPPMARIAAGRELFDRGWGKAPQKVVLDERPAITRIINTIVDPRPDIDTDSDEQEPARRLPNWDYERYGDPDNPDLTGVAPEDVEIIELPEPTDD